MLSLLLTCVLVFERIWKYTITHCKRSSCCGSTFEFNENTKE